MHRQSVRPALACLVAVSLTVLLSAGPALAAEIGDQPAPKVGVVKTLLLFVLAPAAITFAIAAAVWLPGMVRGTRYRPSRGWTAAPVWFAGPPDPATAVQDADAGDVVRGGARGDW